MKSLKEKLAIVDSLPDIDDAEHWLIRKELIGTYGRKAIVTLYIEELSELVNAFTAFTLEQNEKTVFDLSEEIVDVSLLIETDLVSPDATIKVPAGIAGKDKIVYIATKTIQYCCKYIRHGGTENLSLSMLGMALTLNEILVECGKYENKFSMEDKLIRDIRKVKLLRHRERLMWGFN